MLPKMISPVPQVPCHLPSLRKLSPRRATQAAARSAQRSGPGVRCRPGTGDHGDIMGP